MLRVAPLASGQNQSPESSFLTVDARRKQISLQEHVLNQPRTNISAGKNVTMPKFFAFDAVFSPDDTNVNL